MWVAKQPTTSYSVLHVNWHSTKPDNTWLLLCLMFASIQEKKKGYVIAYTRAADTSTLEAIAIQSRVPTVNYNTLIIYTCFKCGSSACGYTFVHRLLTTKSIKTGKTLKTRIFTAIVLQMCICMVLYCRFFSKAPNWNLEPQNQLAYKCV